MNKKTNNQHPYKEHESFHDGKDMLSFIPCIVFVCLLLIIGVFGGDILYQFFR